MSVCPHCGTPDVASPMDCIRCGKPLGPEYHEPSGTLLEQRRFFFRDCTSCGNQHLIRMVRTWR